MARKPSDNARMTITMPSATKEAIEALADQLGVSESYAAQQLIKIGLTHESIAFGGGEVYANLGNGRIILLSNEEGNYIMNNPTFSLLNSGD